METTITINNNQQATVQNKLSSKHHAPFSAIAPLGYYENILDGSHDPALFRAIRQLTDKQFDKLEEMFQYTSRTNNICEYPPKYEHDNIRLHYRYLAALRKKEFAKPIKGIAKKGIYQMLNLRRGMWVLNPFWFKPLPINTDIIVDLWSMLK